MAGAGNRVEREFWEDDYLAGVALPSRPDPELPFERCVARALGQWAPVEHGETVLEVGCAPAKWLVFYAETFGARVRGIEYTGVGAELSRRNLAAAGVDGEIEERDFFAGAAEPADLVLSLGFIEHFDDLDAAFARHVDFTSRGGRLVIGVPNLSYVNGWVQRSADREHLERHNPAALRPSVYERLASRHGLEFRGRHYVGGFDPVIIRLGPRRAAWTAAFTLLERTWRRLRVADYVNVRYLSSYLLTVMERPR